MVDNSLTACPLPNLFAEAEERGASKAPHPLLAGIPAVMEFMELRHAEYAPGSEVTDIVACDP
ncbi:hypothetical protein BIV24_26995 [Streptomyces colonosanans]|uniref:Uncharacterized protein n=1 Tax=Streptomyces colonosanans TaxID=1428652 RepID=A0A1S2NXH1_9ACTN|nr:hypothetical protein BIV24_26995 [Streptomyces colonosanans]